MRCHWLIPPVVPCHWLMMPLILRCRWLLLALLLLPVLLLVTHRAICRVRVRGGGCEERER